jgi:hypothetical protein
MAYLNAHTKGVRCIKRCSDTSFVSADEGGKVILWSVHSSYCDYFGSLMHGLTEKCKEDPGCSLDPKLVPCLCRVKCGDEVSCPSSASPASPSVHFTVLHDSLPVENMETGLGADIKAKDTVIGGGHCYGSNNLITCMEVAGDIIITGTQEGALKFWSIPDKRLVMVFEEAHDGKVLGLLVRSSPQLVYSYGVDGVIQSWNPTSITMVNRIIAQCAPVTTMCFNNKGYMFSGSTDGIVKVWAPIGTRCVNTLDHLKANIASVCPIDDDLCATGCSGEGVIRIWRWKKSEVTRVIRNTSQGIHNLSWVDGHGSLGCDSNTATRHILCSTSDGVITAWTCEGIHAATIKEHSSWILSVSVAPLSMKSGSDSDGYRVASASADRTLAVWLPSLPPGLGGRHTWSVKDCHGGPIYSVMWLNCSTVVTSSSDGQIGLWAV